MADAVTSGRRGAGVAQDMGAIMQDRIARTLEKFADGQATLDEMAQRMGGALCVDGVPVYQGLPEICREWDVPYGRVLAWLMADADRYAVYQRALEVQAHLLVAETVSIADDPENDVARDKLRVETRFRVAKHHASKVYGDKVEHSGLVAPVFMVTINNGPAATQTPENAVVVDGSVI